MTRRAVPVVVVAVLLGVGIDLLTGFSPFPGYAALLGVGGGTLLTLAGKVVLPALVAKVPAYYPDDETPPTQADVLATGPDARDLDGRSLTREAYATGTDVAGEGGRDG